MHSSLRKGFTLIELLVVIAIIGVLSSIVLSSLNTARNKGNDSAVRSNLDNARAQTELFYDSNNNKYVVSPGGTTDVCSPIGLVGNPGVSGIYPNVLAAGQSTGIATVNSAIGTAGGITKATCHACFAGEAGTDCTGTRDGWAAEAPLKSNPNMVYCVDSSGNATTTITTLGPGDTKCG